ncbi:MAG TPA: A24 family peptidase [Thermomicrobiales bacterium]|nr:A24 family peptidase [Thermomicrobiales bacterium]
MLMAAVVAGVVGLFLASVLWRLARRQALRKPLFAGRESESLAAWLPLWGLGQSRIEAETGEERRPWQAVFEVATAAYFAVLGWRFGFSIDLLMVVCFSIPLLVIGLVDFWTRLIHTNVIFLGVALGWVFAVLDGGRGLLDSVIGMAVGGAVFIFFFLAAILIYRNIRVVPFGLGDVYLAAMIGAMVRIDRVMQALLIGIFLAGIILAALLAARVLSRKQAVAYGPYLCLGALITLMLK